MDAALKVKHFNNFSDVRNVVENATSISTPILIEDDEDSQSRSRSSNPDDGRPRITLQQTSLDDRRQAELRDSLARMLSTGRPEIDSLKELLCYLANGDLVDLLTQLVTLEEAAALLQRLAAVVDPSSTDAAESIVEETEMVVMDSKMDIGHDLMMSGEYSSDAADASSTASVEITACDQTVGLPPHQPIDVKAELGRSVEGPLRGGVAGPSGSGFTLTRANSPNERDEEIRRPKRPKNTGRSRSVKPLVTLSKVELPLEPSSSCSSQEDKWIDPQDFEEVEYKPLVLLTTGDGKAWKVKKSQHNRRRRVCGEDNCEFCTARPCGDCYACSNPKNRQKCCKRRCPRLNLSAARRKAADPAEFFGSDNNVREELRCDTCGLYYVSIYSLTKHKEKCADLNNRSITIKYFMCDACSERFATPRLLKSHCSLTKHTSSSPSVYCTGCDSKFTTLSGFYGHYKIKHVLMELERKQEAESSVLT